MKARYFLWRATRIRRRLMQALARQLYRDSDRDIARSVLVAGSARSGTTWLAQIIRSQWRCRIMFEPFYPQAVEQYSGFNSFQYLRPPTENRDLFAYCQRLFSGDLRNRWVDKEVDVLRPEGRLIKAIRANLLLGWIHRNFPEVPIVYIVRHPCAVVASRMELDWATDEDVEPLLEQHKLVSDYIGESLQYIRSLRTDEEKHALIWSLHNVVALRHLAAGAGQVMAYEHLHLQPRIEVPRIFRAIGRPYDESVFDALSKPSTTSTSTSALLIGGDVLGRWRNHLSRQQVKRILSVTERFGLAGLYDDSLTPLEGDGGVSQIAREPA